MPSENAASKSSPSTWLLSLIAVSGVAFLGIQRTDESSGKKPTAETSKTDAPPKEVATPSSFDPLDLLRDYLLTGGKQPKVIEQRSLSAKSHVGDFDTTWSFEKKVVGGNPDELRALLEFEESEYEFLIATVPNPAQSNFPYEFDAIVDGIQRAMEASDRALRAARLPWRRAKKTDAVLAESSESDRNHPGALLFQQGPTGLNSKPKYSLVCLVGENPISGADKVAFTQALEARKRLLAAMEDSKIAKWADSDSHEIKLIAPVFSGSQASLLFAMKSWTDKHACDHFTIVNGGATGLDCGLCQKMGSLTSTVLPNQLLTDGVLSYLTGNRSLDLHNPSCGKPQIDQRAAILRESNTGFGFSQKDSVQHSATPKSRTERPNEAGSINCQLESRQYFSKPVLDLPFPMSIHRLQADASKSGKESTTLPQTGFVESRLSNENRIDAIPPFDPESATSTAGESLRSILETIERANVRYVGIVATDPQDVVFLNRIIRRECPNVRVFATEPSIAFLHPADAADLRGMVVGSTYPLDLRTQEWSDSDGTFPLFPFPSANSQGYYNAVLKQLNMPEKMLGCRAPYWSDKRVNAHRSQPIWISVIGEGGRLTPVHCYTAYGNVTPPLVTPVARSMCEADDGSSSRQLPAVSVPFAVLIAALASVGLLVLVLVALIRQSTWQRYARGISAEDFRDMDSSDETGGTSPKVPNHAPRWMWIWRAVILAATLLFALPFTLPAWEPWCRSLPTEQEGQLILDWRLWSMFGLAVVLNLLLVAITTTLVVRCVSKHTHVGELPGAYGRCAAIVAISWVATLIWWGNLYTAERFFWYVRAVDLPGGLSPVVPTSLLAAAAIVLGWFCLKQTHLSQEVHHTFPYGDAWPVLRAIDDELKAEFRNHLQIFCKPYGRGIGPLLIVPFLICLAWTAFVNSLPTGERVYWDYLLRIIFAAMTSAIMLVVIRGLALWHRLAKLLKEILRIPMVGAFEHLPGEITELFQGSLYSPEKIHFSYLQAAAWALPPAERRQVRELIDDHPEYDLNWIYGLPDPEPTTDGPHKRRDTELAGKTALSAKLNSIAQSFLMDLREGWLEKPIEQAFGTSQSTANEKETDSGSQGPSAEPKTGGKERFIASLVVLYLGRYFAQLRMLVYAMVISAPLTLFAGASYPFQPDRHQLTALAALLVVVALATGFVLYRINKDGLISRIMRTTPNRFTPDLGFFSSVSTYVLPLLGLVMLHSLGLIRFIVEPITGLLQ